MLPVQYHNTEYPSLYTRPCAIIQSGGMKPIGAFWTSTYNNSSSAWLDWCEYEAPNFIKPYNFLLTVNPSAKVYIIDTLEDLEQLISMYPYQNYLNSVLGNFVDWAAMANDGWDGVHVTDAGQWATRLTKPGLYGWDCESTAWFNWVFTNVERI